jgi:hypothetical protein
MATKEKTPNEPSEPVYPDPEIIDPTHRTQALEIRFPNDIIYRILGWSIIGRPDEGKAIWKKGKVQALESQIYEISLKDFGWTKIDDHSWKNGKHTKITTEAIKHLKKYLETSFLYPGKPKKSKD